MAVEVANRDCIVTMEAEIVALAHSCRVLMPIIDMTKELLSAFGMELDSTTMKVSIHEDNAGALVLGKTYLATWIHTQKQALAIKTICFREQIVKRGITLLKIDTKEQLGDIFTKGLPEPAFIYLRQKLIGW
ncbi:hypothetical protein THAOC_00115 [Thalassiosira oceanica]|uniref:Reverse transcriptase Ty1/copia-type domain-containing protein n=1 Tax=Thalassiosira oceanica TaxID=159749 RepID=K0TPK1_THAOC|nr:hypothetical protein THAOC_00115 [Thalassiosira oceanica]|eukprot:EJK78011.1 hypothetical protein THAOC_00115 [Thalassiosira oceanica]